MKQVSIIKIGLAILFVICLTDMPYGYFQLVRFIGVIGFLYLAFNEHQRKNWKMFYIISAILINPIFKISLGRGLWNIIDVAWSVILIGTIVLQKDKKQQPK